MITLHAPAHAKLNLTLDVVGKRPDGYHDLKMVMQEIDLCDELTVILGTGTGFLVRADSGEIPADESNLAVKAARLFFEETGIDCGGLTVEIRKQIPVCAGMGGGSADGAAMLRMLWEHFDRPVPEKRLYMLAEQVGSDVPFALLGGTALAEEKGQVLTRLKQMPDCRIVLCKPPFPVSTPELFRAVDRATVSGRPDTDGMLQALEREDLREIAKRLRNVFTPLISRRHPEIAEIRNTLISHGVLGASMSGSGPTMFGLFDDDTKANQAYHALKMEYSDTFLARPV